MNRVDRSRRGIVLLMVLGILALMSVLAVSFVQLSRMERAISSSYVQRTRASMIAESGLEYAVARLGDMAGVISPEDAEAMRYVEDPVQSGLKHAIKVSFDMADNLADTPSVYDNMRSGIVGSSLTENGDFYKLAVTEESSKLNLNDTNNPWNIDTDPWIDGNGDDPDLAAGAPPIPNRLAAVVQELGAILFDSEITGADIANTLFDELQADSRPNQPGRMFSSMEQIHDLLVPAVLTEAEYAQFAANVTIYSWQDPDVLRPTFQFAVTAPDTVPADEFDVYMYSDFQTKYFELEPRSPVNVNTASVELLQALIRPVQGWYLYEGAPCSFMDGEFGPWLKCMRHMGHSYKDKDTANGYPGTHYYPMEDGIWSGTLSPLPRQSDSKDWTLGRGTRYGQAQLTRSLEPYAESLALSIHLRIHDEGKPFETWDEFSRFLYSMVDTDAVITTPTVNSQATGDTPLDYNLNADEEAARFPYRLSDDSAFTSAASVLPGFDRYMADALLANFNPNSQLNDHNPDFHIFRHVDKAQLTRHTTELSFCPTGVFHIRSLGMILDAAGHEQSAAEISTTMRMYHLLRHTTQAQFMRGYAIDEPSSIYDLFRESFGIAPTAGADLLDGEGTLSAGGAWGPSVTSYPEPVRLPGSLSVEGNPSLLHAAGFSDYFSKYDGYLMLSTYQFDADSWRNLVAGELPQFMATMGYRDLAGESASAWKQRSLAVGGMMPLRYGKNPDGVGDDIDTMSVAGGRGAVLSWIEDYARPTTTISAEQQAVIDAVMAVYPDFPVGVPQAIIDLLESLVASIATTDRLPSPSAWVSNAPWENHAHWNHVKQDNSDHWDFGSTLNLPWTLGFSAPRYTYLWRPGWNLPSDMPVTPDVFPGLGAGRKYPAIGGGQVQGNLFADGVFSDSGRLLSYPSSNMGSLAGSRGTVSFWFKPHWDAGFSNRIRSIFNMGDPSSCFTHGIDLIYFPAAKRPDGLGGRETDTASCLGIGANAPRNLWPMASHSFFCGWLSQNWNVSIAGYGRLQEARYACSDTTTDFFPMRDINQRGLHDALAFYGHQWNHAAITYDARTYRQYNALRNEPGVDDVNYMINGQLINSLKVSGMQPPVGNLSWEPIIDFWWEENIPVHVAWMPSVVVGTPFPKPVVPKNLQMGERCMRFGWHTENGGPTGDSTYDDITAWAGYYDLSPFAGYWQQGRYCGEPLLDAGTNATAAGLFTSASLDLFKEFPDLSRNSNAALVLKAVMWTGYWPRYNWRPTGDEGTDNYASWATSTDFSGMVGEDVVANRPDPVTGNWDPFTVDVRMADGTWMASGDTEADDMNLFRNMEKMMANGGGSATSAHAAYQRGQSFQYRVYFHNPVGQSLLESPVLDDITFLFTSSKPVVLTYQVIS